MNKGKKINLIINIVAILIILILMLFIFFKYKDSIIMLETEEGRNQLIEKIQSTGIFGGLVIIIIQALQIVVAFIPGEFVEIISGAMFGPIIGLLLCLVGLNIGTLMIFGLVKLLGKPFVNKNTKNNHKKLKFLNDPRRALVILFFIFLLPGIPKDILIFPIPLTKIKMHKFMIVSSIARVPSIVSSTIVGSSIINENYNLALISFVVTLVLAILGLIFNKQIYEYIIKKYNKNKNVYENDIHI